MTEHFASRFPLLVELPAAERENDPLEERTTGVKVLVKGRIQDVVDETIALPDGRPSHRFFLTHPGAAAIVARYPDGSILLERQWRHPLRKSFWEIPAGKIDPNERVDVCAARELKEECGVEAAKWSYLGVIHNAIGYSNERIELFLAEELMEGEQRLDEGEHLEVYRVPFDEALRMTADGRITDAKTISALMHLELRERG